MKRHHAAAWRYSRSIRHRWHSSWRRASWMWCFTPATTRRRRCISAACSASATCWLAGTIIQLQLPLTLDRFCQLEFVMVSPDGGGFSAATDRALAGSAVRAASRSQCRISCLCSTRWPTVIWSPYCRSAGAKRAAAHRACTAAAD